MNNEQRPGDPFAPEIVDEKIEQFLQVRDEQQADIHLVHELKSIYQEDADILARARTRLFQKESITSSVGTQHEQKQSRANLQQGQTGHNTTHEKQEVHAAKNLLHDYRRYKRMKQETPQPEQAGTHRFALVAAVIFATFLVGSMAGLAYFTHHTSSSQTSQTGAAKTAPQQSDQPKSSKGMPGTTPGVYIGTDHNVVRTDVQTGKIFWTYKLPVAASDTLKAPKVILNGDTVYVELMSMSQKVKSAVVALDAQSGAVRWTHEFDAGWLSDLSIFNGVVYGSVAVNPGRGGVAGSSPSASASAGGSASDKSSSIVYALNPVNGMEQAKYQFASYVEHISISAGVLYITASHNMSAANLSDGKQLWSISTDNTKQIVAGPHVANGFVYTTILDLTDASGNGMSSVIAAFNADSGAKVWQSDAVGTGPIGITVANTTIYVGTNDGTIAAYDELQGKRLWSHLIGNSIQSSVFVANGVVYVSADNSFSASEKIVAVNASTGQEKWHALVKGGSGPIIFATNGFVYVASDSTGVGSSSVYALKTSDGSQLWNTSIAGFMETINVIP